ncbi:Flavin-containing monooxygenase FMO GS-OX-like 2 [Eufriesea mexicana]|uniref:Flavin-containing monooxygenase n=1 Tax=Eufriesea mexicana TaxID=516756 RepID=A0A310S4F8_9HYME|nr:PREDICTED: flavin-containing monooxygenase FMO GS-OX-like 2 [Eufriesea mexicana]XP_017765058.1 PREDICTED: flavin-containing monooxygenase FMO GS-OX-like 2 [Eufriesea mexicana]OAD52045.1 Flavin-containing monooxygenase FMO GS-OX-like 2 [Eufriesea mexicana]
MAELMERRKVCVIGAGAAGLCATNHFARSSNFELKVYEQTNDIGGTWIYKEATEVDENGLPVHSSMYRDLRTNLPAAIMNFPNYRRLNAEEPCCVTHQEVRTYLQNYAEHFDLVKHIQFGTRVESVRLKTSAGGKEEWSVRVKIMKTKEEEEIIFDAIMICNGHYFDPYMPTIPGIENFPGTIIHSHSYRKAEDFAGKSVLILGAAASGVDIAVDLANHVTRVYLSHNNERLNNSLGPNIIEVLGVEKIETEKIFLKDHSFVTVDVFMFCTGYWYSFPFLDESCGIRVDDNFITPLYKHLINIVHPTMCIIGVPTVVVPFPMFHIQVQYFLALLEKRASLPSTSVMLEDSTLKTLKKRHAHKLMNKQWEYNDSLADAGGFDRLPKFYKLGYEIWSSQRKASPLNYKQAKFVISKDERSIQLFLPN